MKNSTKAKLIVDVIKERTTYATINYINAKANMARAQTGYELWEKEHRDDFGNNPYKIEAEEKTVTRTLEEKIAREEVLAYAIDVFLEKIPDKKIA